MMFNLTKEDFPKGLIQGIHPTGSKYICNPPVLTTDEDYYAYTPNPSEAFKVLQELGWNLCTSVEYEDDAFTAFRKGDYNLILLFTIPSYVAHVQATELAKRFNLINKQDRIDLFELVRSGSYAGGGGGISG